MYIGLSIASGLFWVATYLLIIQKSFRDRVYGMPLVAVCCNLSWEFIYTVVYPHDLFYNIIFGAGLILDLLILWTVLRFGPAQFPGIPRPVFYAGFLGTLALASAGILAISAQLHTTHGLYAAFIDNLLMSALFLGMLNQRRSLAGQSVGIAACKLIGTALASVQAWFFWPAYAGSPLLIFLYVGCFVLDIAYLAGVLAVRRSTAGGTAISDLPVESARGHGLWPQDGTAPDAIAGQGR